MGVHACVCLCVHKFIAELKKQKGPEREREEIERKVSY